MRTLSPTPSRPNRPEPEGAAGMSATQRLGATGRDVHECFSLTRRVPGIGDAGVIGGVA